MADAYAELKDLLARYGLPSLTDWAWQQLVAGKSQEEIALNLYDQPAFKERFPAIELRRAAGLNAMSPAEYVAYETQARQLMRAVGFPPSFYDQPDDFTKFIAGDVSLNELNQRATLYQQAAFATPVEVRQQLNSLYGVTEGDIAAYFADPTRALPLLQQKFSAAQASGAAVRTGYGGLTINEAERLAGLGVNGDQAQQGFAQLANAKELFNTLPGENADAIGRDAQQAAVFGGDAAAKRKIEKRAAERVGQASGAQSFSLGQKGAAGLGVEART